MKTDLLSQNNVLIRPSSVNMSSVSVLPSQGIISPGSLKGKDGSIPLASHLHCKLPSRPVMEPRTTATSLENRSCQVT